MKRFSIILSCTLLLLPLVVGAQTLSNKERRELNACILSLVKDYERNASLQDEESEYVFRSLFENDDVCVFCDVPGAASYMTEMSLSDYVSLLKEYSPGLSMVMKDVVKGEPEYAGEEWIVSLHFMKNVSYMDDAGYFFSIEDFHGTGASISMHLVYDKDQGRCLIRSMEGEVDSAKIFPEDRFVILNKDQQVSDLYQGYDPLLTVGGQVPVYNKFGQAILPHGEFIVEDPDVEVMTDIVSEESGYDVMAYRLHMRNARIRFISSYSPFTYIVQTPDDVSSRSNAMEIGLECGVSYPIGRITKYSVNGGVTLALSSLRLDSAVQQRHQVVRYLDLAVPVYVEFEHRLFRSLSLAWNVGLKGYYEVESSKGYSKNPFDLTAMANLGVDVNLYKSKIYLMARGGYEYGIFKHFPISAYQHSLMKNVIICRGTVWISAGVKLKL